MRQARWRLGGRLSFYFIHRIKLLEEAVGGQPGMEGHDRA